MISIHTSIADISFSRFHVYILKASISFHCRLAAYQFYNDALVLSVVLMRLFFMLVHMGFDFFSFFLQLHLQSSKNAGLLNTVC